MKTTPTAIGIVSAIVLNLSTPASADHEYEGISSKNAHYDYAKVVNAEPIYRSIRVAHPRRECWDERVVHHEHHDSYRSKTPMILGGIIGGAVGNQAGKGRGRDLATAAGVILGASIGNDISRNNHRDSRHQHVYEETERVCRTVHDYVEEREIEGYDVTYRYRGELYHTVTDYHPGKRIRVAVSVQAVE